MYDALTEKGAISRHGGWAIMSEDALVAAYAATGTPVYERDAELRIPTPVFDADGA